MAADRVEIVHPPTDVHALIKPRLLPGWQRMGWVLADEVDAAPTPLPGALAGDQPISEAAAGRRAAHKLPAQTPGTTDDLAAGSSSSETEGAQP